MKFWLSFLLLLAIAGSLGTDLASGADYVAVTVGSYHFDRSHDYNEHNFGLGYERRFDENWHGHVGYYRNSFDRTTTYALASYAPWSVGEWHFGVVGGLGTGYDSPMLVSPIAIREWRTFGINVLLHPAAVAVQLKWSIK